METKKSIKYHNICFVAGKSGGHILPCITLAQQAVNKHPHYEVMFFSTASPFDKQLVNGNAIIKHYIPLSLSAFPKTNLLGYPKFLWRLMASFFTSFNYLRRLKPEVVISTGGYISIPVCLAARLLKIPVELYELNAIPGKAISFLAPLAHKIWICFEKTTQYLPAHKCTLTSYPIKFTDQTKDVTHQQALEAIGFTAGRKTILVLGGSQGSLFINAAMRILFEKNPTLKDKIQIIHQTGASDSTDWKAMYADLAIPSLVFSYSDELAAYYAAADLVICRSGAGTLAEVSFFNKLCVTIPLETATTNHQVDNAVAAVQMRPDLFKIVRQDEIEHDAQALFASINAGLQLI